MMVRKRFTAWCTGRYAAVREALRTRAQAGMTTAEYAVGTVAACAFAMVLYKLVESEPIRNALRSVIVRALDAQF
ncbi:DUF4244 domain-containing protein [Streptomyces pactum]|nr:DUF4244 domain-containing protein [Streptomyces pactum]